MVEPLLQHFMWWSRPETHEWQAMVLKFLSSEWIRNVIQHSGKRKRLEQKWLRNGIRWYERYVSVLMNLHVLWFVYVFHFWYLEPCSYLWLCLLILPLILGSVCRYMYIYMFGYKITCFCIFFFTCLVDALAIAWHIFRVYVGCMSFLRKSVECIWDILWSKLVL